MTEYIDGILLLVVVLFIYFIVTSDLIFSHKYFNTTTKIPADFLTQVYFWKIQFYADPSCFNIYEK